MSVKFDKNFAVMVRQARAEIESKGWRIVESDGFNNEIHLALHKGEHEKRWGFFDPVLCWSYAYREISGKDFLTLLPRKIC